MVPPMSYWWCLKHSRVEDDDGCALTDRMGPYATPEEASQAFARARARTRDGLIVPAARTADSAAGRARASADTRPDSVSAGAGRQ